MRNLSIKLKLALATVACLAVLATVAALLARQRYGHDIAFAGETAVRSAAVSFEGLERRELEKLGAAMAALVGDPTLTASFSQRDFDRLFAAAAPIFQDLKEGSAITDWDFIEPPPARTVFQRVHRPDLHDDPADRATVLNAIRTGEVAAGKELDRTGFALRVVRPYVAHGRLIGYMGIGEQIDNFLGRMKADTGDDYALVVLKRHLDAKTWAASRGARRNNWDDDAEVLAVESTSAVAPIRGAGGDVREVPDGGRYLGTVEHENKLFVRGVVPVRDVDGHKVGGLFVLHDVSSVRDRAVSDRNRDILTIVLAALVVLGLILFGVELLVFRRLEAMTKAMEDVSLRVAGGDYDVAEAMTASAANDEIGRFERFLGSFLGTIGATLRELEKRRTRS